MQGANSSYSNAISKDSKNSNGPNNSNGPSNSNGPLSTAYSAPAQSLVQSFDHTLVTRRVFNNDNHDTTAFKVLLRSYFPATNTLIYGIDGQIALACVCLDTDLTLHP